NEAALRLLRGAAHEVLNAGCQARSKRFETPRHRLLVGRWLSAGVDGPQIGEQVVDVAGRQPERRHARVSHFDASDECPSEVLDRVALVEVAQRWRLCDGAGAGEVDCMALRALLFGDFPTQLCFGQYPGGLGRTRAGG